MTNDNTRNFRRDLLSLSAGRLSAIGFNTWAELSNKSLVVNKDILGSSVAREENDSMNCFLRAIFHFAFKEISKSAHFGKVSNFA